jgi:hypothetical protein
MTTTQRNAGVLALAGAAAYLTLSAVHLTHGTFDSRLTTAVDYVNDGSFLLALTLTIPALLVLRASRDLPRRALAAVAAGQSLVAIGVAAALIAGESPSWFAAVGLPGNLLAFAGWLIAARGARRRGTYPLWLAILMGTSVPVGLLGAEAGLTAVPALLWLALGLDLVRADAPWGRRAAYAA